MGFSMRHILALTVCAGLLLSSGGRAQSAAPEPGALQGVRAVWVLRTSLRSAASVRTMVKAASDAGFNTLLLQVRGRGEAYYRSRIDPRAADLPADFDPLALAVELAHEAGLSVHAWVNVNLVASAVNLPRSPTHVVRRHPEWLMVPRALTRDLARTKPAAQGYLTTLAGWTRRQSDTVEGLYLSPLTREARDYSVSVIREIVDAYAIDGVHLDYIRYPGDGFDFSPAALAEFRASRLPETDSAERDRLDAAARRDASAWTTYLPESWAAFRRDRLTALVEGIVAAVSDARPAIPVTAAVVPDEADARARKGQDWVGWARDGLIDAVCPMAYTTDRTLFAQQVAGVRTAVDDVPVWAGIGAYRLTAAQTAAHVRLARGAGAVGIALFSYDSVAASRDGGARYFAELRPALIEGDTQAVAR